MLGTAWFPGLLFSALPRCESHRRSSNKVHAGDFYTTQCFGHHARPGSEPPMPMFTTSVNCFPGIVLPAHRDDRFREGLHLHTWWLHILFAINQNRGIATVTQRYVKHSAVFSAVDFLAKNIELIAPARWHSLPDWYFASISSVMCFWSNPPASNCRRLRRT